MLAVCCKAVANIGNTAFSGLSETKLQLRRTTFYGHICNFSLEEWSSQLTIHAFGMLDNKSQMSIKD
jgi:hypothetical protein